MKKNKIKIKKFLSVRIFNDKHFSYVTSFKYLAKNLTLSLLFRINFE